MESAFNNIWEVQSSRNIARQYLNYIVIAMVAPILWLVASTMGGYLLRFFDAGNTFLGILLSKLSALVIIWGSFTLIYAVVPNTKVLWRSAFMAGIVAGTVFMLFQWGYLYLQGWMTSYNAIYGSFAALPLFLLWLQISWEILLFGGRTLVRLPEYRPFRRRARIARHQQRPTTPDHPGRHAPGRTPLSGKRRGAPGR